MEEGWGSVILHVEPPLISFYPILVKMLLEKKNFSGRQIILLLYSAIALSKRYTKKLLTNIDDDFCTIL